MHQDECELVNSASDREQCGKKRKRRHISSRQKCVMLNLGASCVMMMVSPDLNCRLLCKTVLLMAPPALLHPQLVSFTASQLIGFNMFNVSSCCCSCSTLLTVHTYKYADWPPDIQQLGCVFFVYWSSDADSQGCTDLHSLVNLSCLHCGDSAAISSCAQLHQAVQCNEVH